MKTEEKAAAVLVAGRKAAEALVMVRELTGARPMVHLGVALAVPVVRAIAALMASEVRTQSYNGSGRPEVLEATSGLWEGVEISCQGVRPLSAEDLPKPVAPDICSECSGPLADGMGCSPQEGRCGSCVYEEAERGVKRRQDAEDRLGRQRAAAEDLREKPRHIPLEVSR